MKTIFKFIFLGLCWQCIGLNGFAFNPACQWQDSTVIKRNWIKSTVINTGATAGAFSQQYYKYLRTDILFPTFLAIPMREYEYSIVRYNYILPSVGLSQIYTKNKHKNIHLCFDLQPGLTKGNAKVELNGIFTTRFLFNKKYWGFGFGASLGNKLFIDEVYRGGYDKNARTQFTHIRLLPDLRFGRLDIFYFEVTRMKPATIDAIDYLYGIGTGFGSTNKFSLRIGYSIKHERNGKYCELRVPINKKSFLNVYGGYSNQVKRQVAIAPNSEYYNEIDTNAWFTGIKVNWYL